MSATSGTLAALAIWLKAAVDSSSGQETLTMSAPASSNSRIWPMVALASAVRVLVIDWTVIGASPPTSTDPTRILRLGRRWIMRQGRTWLASWARLGSWMAMWRKINGSFGNQKAPNATVRRKSASADLTGG